MVIRILAYDPDPQGRRLLRRAFPHPTSDSQVLVRASSQACQRALAQADPDMLLLGLPVPPQEMAELLTCAQELSPPPLVVFAGDPRQSAQQDAGTGWIGKNHDGLASLLDRFGPALRAREIRRILGRLDSLVLQDAEGTLEAVAAALVAELKALYSRAGFVYRQAGSGRWLEVVSPEGGGGSLAALALALFDGLDIGGAKKTTQELFPVSGGLLQDAEEVIRWAEELGVPGPQVAHLRAALDSDGAVYLLPIITTRGPSAVLMVCGNLHESERQSLDRLQHPLQLVLECKGCWRRAQGLAALPQVLKEIPPTVLHASQGRDPLGGALRLLASVLRCDIACLVLTPAERFVVDAVHTISGIPAMAAPEEPLQLSMFPALAEILSSRRPVLVGDLRADPHRRCPALRAESRAWLGVPVPQPEDRIGILWLESHEVGFWSPDDAASAALFAQYLGLALAYVDVNERERKVRRSIRLHQDLAYAPDENPRIEDIAERLCRQALEALEVGRAEVGVRTARGELICARILASTSATHSGSNPARTESGCSLAELLFRIAERDGLASPRLLTHADLSGMGDDLASQEVASLLLVPVRRGGTLVGVLALDDPGQPRAFDEEETALAQAIASHAAAAILNAATVADLQRQSEELTSLFNLGVSLSRELTTDGVVDLLLEQIQSLLEIDTVVVARLEGPATLYCDILDYGRRLPALRVPLTGPTLSGYVIRTGAPLLINNYDAEVDTLPVPGLTAGAEIASWLGVPLVVRGGTVGAVSVQSQKPYQFDEKHLRFLRMIANQVAISLENARLMQTTAQRAEQLRLVNEIGRYAVSVLDSQHLVREVALEILRSFKYYAVQILLTEGGALVPHAVARGPDGELLEMERNLSLRDTAIIAEVARTGSPLLVSDVTGDPRFLAAPELPDTQVELAVPLMIGNDVVGVLDVQSDRSGGLTAADMDLLQVLAAQIAISVANARLFAEVRAHAAQLEARVTARTAEIRSQKERTEAILRSVADAVVVLSLEGELLLANPVAQDLLGGPQGSEVMTQIGRMHAQGGVVSETLELGQTAFQALASPVTLGDLAVGTVIVLRDITRMRELDRLKSHFVATVSHELRTPLANIKLYLSLMRKGRDERRGQYIQVLEQEAGRLSQMIEDLLDLSRLESKQELERREPVELILLLEQVLESHRPSLQAKGLQARMEECPPVVVPGRRSQLIQVFANLVSNSIQYTPVGGRIRLVVKPDQIVGGVPMVAVSVEDTGQGIPESDIPYIFDRFYRGSLARNNNIPGSGLGLAIVREILDRHGGHITVSSRMALGSTFTVWLPASEEG
jgi:signal transduction histidine kinase